MTVIEAKDRSSLTVYEFLYYASLVTWLAASIIRESMLLSYVDGFIWTGIRIGSLLTLLLGLITKRSQSKKVMLALAVVAFLAVSVFMGSGNDIQPEALIFMVLSYDLDFDKTIRVCLYTTIIAVSSVLLLCTIGLIPNLFVFGGDRGFRYYLGFRYTTYLSHFYLSILCMLIVLRDGRSWKGLLRALVSGIVLLVLNEVIYRLTQSRNSYYLSIIAIVILTVSNIQPLKPMKTHRLKGIIAGVPVALSAISFAACYYYDESNPLHRTINELLSYRLRYSHESLTRYGLKLFGSNVLFIGNGVNKNGDTWRSLYVYGDTNYVDSAYVLMGIRYGLVFLAIFLVCLIICNATALSSGLTMTAVAFIILEVHGMVDVQLLSLSYTPILLYFGVTLNRIYQRTARDDLSIGLEANDLLHLTYDKSSSGAPELYASQQTTHCRL